MRIFGVVTVIALLMAGPALAQQKSVPKYGDVDKEKSQSDIAAEKEAERAYQRSLGNIPEQTRHARTRGARCAVIMRRRRPQRRRRLNRRPSRAKVDAKADGAAKQ